MTVATGTRTATALADVLSSLPELVAHHRPGPLHRLYSQVASREAAELFSGPEAQPVRFGPFGELRFPYHSMGAIDSLDLFGLDELILFSYYWSSRRRYRRVVDIGANLGLHSILLSRAGHEVRAFEPDPRHFELLERNLALNGCAGVHPSMAAVSGRSGVMEFVRVLGNTTGSHLAGSKSNPYGEMERFGVEVEGIGPLMDWADLVKIDAEGHEREILLATERRHWEGTDVLVEVGSEENAAALHRHLSGLGVIMNSQKTGWRRVKALGDMPTGHREGTLFASLRGDIDWTRGQP